MKAEVTSIEVFSEDNFVLKLAKPEGFEYRAGQFAMLHFNSKQKPFSIASHPSEEELIFLIKEHDNGDVTPHLMELKEGDEVEITGPFGVYEVKASDAEEIVFIAAGTGVAPFRSMILDVLERFPDKRVRLIFGFRYDFYFGDFWEGLKKEHSNFDYYVCCSRPKEAKWEGACGRITDDLEERIGGVDGKDVYVCGSEGVVEGVKDKLFNDMKFPKERVHIEEWHNTKGGKQ